MNTRLNGTVVPLVTPLEPGGSVCERSVQRLVESVASSASALLPCLSSGEGRKLSREQWQGMVSLSIRHAQGLPVFPGVLVETTDELSNRALFAARAGAAGVTLAVPSIASRGVNGVIDYFEQLIKKLPVPVFLYNQESEATVESTIEALSKVCRMNGVVAIKESSRKPEVAATLRQQKVPAAVFQGWEDLCYKSQDVDGNALALANLESPLCIDMYRAPTQEKQQSLIALCEKYKLFADDWYLPLKTELCKRGILTTNLAAA